MNKISIGIPVYNQSTTIAETIESALAQSLTPFEIVVSENHSTDGTKEIVESYSDRVRIIRPPEHYSMCENWNFCVNSCEGEWIGLCSGDDLILPNYIKSMSEGIKQDKNAVFIMGGWEVLNEINGKIKSHYLLSMEKIVEPPKTIKMQLSGPKASFAAFCFKKKAFDEVGGYDKEFYLIQDWILQFDLAKIGSFVKINKLVARYRISERPVIESQRIEPYIKDLLRFLSIKIWEAESYNITLLEIKLSAQETFFRMLEYIKLNKSNIDQKYLVEMSQIAVKIEASKEWEQWQLGNWKPVKKNIQLMSILRIMIRKFYNLTH